MAERTTEALHEKANGIDTLSPFDALSLLAAAQAEAAKSPAGALAAIAEAARLAAEALRDGRRLVYAGAGSSGLMAMADALELPGTFGIPRDRIEVLLAGGAESLLNLAGAPEDDLDAARADARRAVSEGDCLICVSASGSTPYTLALAEEAKSLGARIVSIANNAGTPLLALADAAILLETPPEMVSGSTRMGAGTAQKIALNMISTLMAIQLGHVHDGRMVNLFADNEKLRQRAAGIVSAVAGVGVVEATEAIKAAGGAVKTAIVLAAGAKDKSKAEEILSRTSANVRAALKLLGHA
ncbi:N-acetylmuramic acid 6-phosphate etherase [Rhizobium sp. TRM95796]|uniref:N-acetylmuramic acid 6-phosphate etherase n=1 Tax=Rhizobium sp. TRM95796 TaxID=2979862 RepID=UPI0021E6DD42|nr:N-acetylmuramic acid 6-phosphate etherase [Rhizobium sp. TRM95796]MCV3766763.1 N-acetylmuramic acid 6-phosphate etherase [Rhizobium sp. TRM95796]